MFNLKTIDQKQFSQYWQGQLSDYVTAIAWSPDGQILAASSAQGEVVLWRDRQPLTLQPGRGFAINCLRFSHDGQFLAAGGQDGRVSLWQDRGGEFQLVGDLRHSSAWVDRLAWSPTTQQLAVNSGREVLIWQAQAGQTPQLEAQLSFGDSSVLDLDWHPQGKSLALGGYQGLKVWSARDWASDPEVMEVPSASLAVAWSPDGKYLAAGNLDRTLLVWERGHVHPWQMQGFPGKVRQLAWAKVPNSSGTALLASCSADGLVAWQKDSDPEVGWQALVLEHHIDVVEAIAFQPRTLLLASASVDGHLSLWQGARRLAQVLDGAAQGFACLAWHPQGDRLAAGGCQGEVLIWKQDSRGQGFGKR
jgi:WD40 repeat protein